MISSVAEPCCFKKKKKRKIMLSYFKVFQSANIFHQNVLWSSLCKHTKENNFKRGSDYWCSLRPGCHNEVPQDMWPKHQVFSHSFRDWLSRIRAWQHWMLLNTGLSQPPVCWVLSKALLVSSTQQSCSLRLREPVLQGENRSLGSDDFLRGATCRCTCAQFRASEWVWRWGGTCAVHSEICSLLGRK